MHLTNYLPVLYLLALGVKAHIRPFVEESFGPIAPLLSFSAEEEAVAIANDTR